MTPRTFALVQDSFKAVVVSETAAEMFCTELLAIDPSLRTKFNGDMLMLRKNFLAELAVVVRSLHAHDRVASATMIGRDISFGVALLRTLRKAMGDAFTPELHDAWMEAFRTASGGRKS